MIQLQRIKPVLKQENSLLTRLNLYQINLDTAFRYLYIEEANRTWHDVILSKGVLYV